MTTFNPTPHSAGIPGVFHGAMKMDQNFLTTRDLAKILPFCQRHIAERITLRKDFPPARRVGARRFWPAAEVMAWIESRKEK